VEALAAIDPAGSLRERMVQAADLINDRFADNARLMTAARTAIVTGGANREATERMSRSREALLAALTTVIEPDAALLRRSPAATARLLLLFAGANAYGPFADPGRVNGAEMVSLLLDGLLKTSDRKDGTC
jgi:hypothetical protein